TPFETIYSVTGFAAVSVTEYRAGPSDRRFDPFLDFVLGQGSDLGRRDLTLAEDHHRGDAADAIFLRHMRILVDIDLGDRDLAAHFARKLLERRSDHAAGPAPFRPEIHDHGGLRIQNIGLEGGIGDLDGFGHGLGPWYRWPQ